MAYRGTGAGVFLIDLLREDLVCRQGGRRGMREGWQAERETFASS